MTEREIAIRETGAPKAIWAWCFNVSSDGGWGEWGGYARPSNLCPMDAKERQTGAEYLLAAEHERLMAERDAEIARLREARILVLPNGHTGVCVGGRFNGWLMCRHPDGQWVSVVKLLEGALARAALGDDNGE